MRIDQIRAALKVHELKSFTAAGKALYVTRGVARTQVVLLEQELGFRLFDRKAKGCKPVLTEKGATFLMFASQAVRLLEEGVQEAAEMG